MLWAWERPEDLRFIDPAHVGVAYLAKTIVISDRGVRIHPRWQRLRVPEGTVVMAVVRLEVERGTAASRLVNTLPQVAREIVALSRHPVRGIQVDFDARRSERHFYLGLLHSVRNDLPSATSLSMTALASWCMEDRWLQTVPVDEIVPMLFAMGPETIPIRHHFRGGQDFQETRCRSSLGLASNEPITVRGPARRLYLFHHAPWTRQAFTIANKEVFGFR